MRAGGRSEVRSRKSEVRDNYDSETLYLYLVLRTPYSVLFFAFSYAESVMKISFLFVAICVVSCATSFAEDKPATDAELARQKEQLARVQKLIGGWKGVGQPQRG